VNIMLRRTLKSLLVAASALIVLSACSSGTKRPDPTPLKPVTVVVPATLAWQVAVGPVDPLMTPAVQGGQVFVANAAGVVSALDGGSGRVLWRQDLGGALSAGVGSDGRTVAAVTRQNELVAVSQDGALWRVALGARVFTAPLVAGERVFVLAADRSVSAYDGRTGIRLWTQPARGADPLVLQQPGVLVAVGDTLLAGVSGRLVAFNPLNGRVVWDAAIANPRGVNEIERLVDLVGRVGRVDNQVCARAFQSAVGCVDTERGTVRWTQPSDGGVGVHADAERVYGVESNGRVLAWRRSNGERLWAVDPLLHRGLTAPLAAGRSIIVGDAQGFVHLLSREDGGVLNRLSTDGSPVVYSPVLVGQTLVAVTRNGGVFAWRPE
jgi:outer membrane protein assembly factor BamB